MTRMLSDPQSWAFIPPGKRKPTLKGSNFTKVDEIRLVGDSTKAFVLH